MSNFDAPLIIEYDRRASDELGGDFWRVKKSFRFYLPPVGNTGFEISNRWAYVPEGVLSDLGSIPKLFRSLVDRDGRAAQAYVLHDHLCEYLSVTFNGSPHRISRNVCDAIMAMAMIDLGVDRKEVAIVHRAVRTYGSVMGIKNPSTTERKRQLEADYNFEGLI